jgi:hypothetical protein
MVKNTQPSSGETKNSQVEKQPPRFKNKEQKEDHLRSKYKAEFEAGFWAKVVPGKKEGKDKSLLTYATYRESGVSEQEINSAYEFDCRKWQEQGRELKYIPGSQSWLNKKRWLDDDLKVVVVEAQQQDEVSRLWEEVKRLAKLTRHSIEEREGMHGGRYMLDGRVELKQPDRLAHYINRWQKELQQNQAS